MSTTRLTQGMVLACIAALAACTSSGEEGPAGNTELNVMVPTQDVDIQTVEYTINCLGTEDDTFLDDDTPREDAVTLNGNLEVVDGRTSLSAGKACVGGSRDGEPCALGAAGQTFCGAGTCETVADFGQSPGNFPLPGNRSEIWQGFTDGPPGACTVELRARDNDGEVICTAREPFTITADTVTKINLLLICDTSFNAPVGQFDVDGTFSFVVSNFCPDLFILNCLDSTPALPVDGDGIPTGVDASTTCEVRFRDGDSQCGQSCDPQDCQPDGDAGLVCTPAPEPRVCPNGTTPCTADGDCPNGTCDLRGPQTVVTCVGGSADCDGDGSEDANGCTYNGDQLGSLMTNISQMRVPNPATFDVLCDSASAGAIVTCTAVTTDGDLDCDRTETVEVTCPGDTPCTEYGGDAKCTADAATVCRADVCDTTNCDGATNAACCDRVDVADGLNCSAENNDLPAECQGGVCTPTNCTTNQQCDDENQCTETLSCDVPNGLCCVDGDTNGCSQNDTAQPKADGDQCTDGNADPDKGGYCLGGDCEAVECRDAGDCDDTEFCTIDDCDTGELGGLCSNTNRPDNTDCSSVGGTGAVCFVVAPDPVSRCVVGDCTSDGQCDDSNSCTADSCDTQIAGGLCVHDPTDQVGDTCATPNADEGTCSSLACGVCIADGSCYEKGITCDTVNRDPGPCRTAEILAVDCFLLGSGAPIPLDVEVTQLGAAFAGIPVQIVPQGAIVLPAALLCGFATVVTTADILNSQLNFAISNANPTAASTFSFQGDPLQSPHPPAFEDFNVGCGNFKGTCAGTVDGTCDDPAGLACKIDGDCNIGGTCTGTIPGTCSSDGFTECIFDDGCQGTGPGVIVPFLPRGICVAASPGSGVCANDGVTACTNDVDGLATGCEEFVTPNVLTPTSTNTFLQYTYLYKDVGLFVFAPSLFANICIGGIADAAGGCAFQCFPADRDGDGIPNIDGEGTIGPNDSPRIMVDSGCDKIGVAACGGTDCSTNGTPDCPLAGLGQTCNTAAGVCNNIAAGRCDLTTGPAVVGTCDDPPGLPCLLDNDCEYPGGGPQAGTCSGNTPGLCVTDGVTPCGDDADCPDGAGGQLPSCCEPFFDFSGASNVCLQGQPGSALAVTQSPRECGDCQPLGCSSNTANASAGGTCAEGPNAEEDCTTDTDCPTSYCVVFCTSCNDLDCCNWVQGRYLTAQDSDFPAVFVNACDEDEDCAGGTCNTSTGVCTP